MSEEELVERILEQQRLIQQMNTHYEKVTVQLEREVAAIEAALQHLKSHKSSSPASSSQQSPLFS
jgi:hypothetical protein